MVLAVPLLWMTTCVPLVVQQETASSPSSPGRLALGSGVPLVPNPIGFQSPNGASWLDLDADGWPDLFTYSSGELYRNEAGQGFLRLPSLRPLLPPGARYGSSAGDYDADGFPDIAGEPRGGCIGLLHALDGRGAYAEVASNPEVVLGPPSCGIWAETSCWADVDDDRDLDLWVTAYLEPPSSGGNHFFENLGATGPRGAFRFRHRTDVLRRSLPPAPEGAQFVDVDRDGDADGFANGACYQNLSRTGQPQFLVLAGVRIGIFRSGHLDEGLLFMDHDLDGDQDLVLVHVNDHLVRLYDNEGDGTFRVTSDVLELPREGGSFGCSAEDWDLDGDVDLTATDTFRRNDLIEAGEPFLRVVPAPPIRGGPLSPAWADWDRDGDPDCVASGWFNDGFLMRNVTYEPGTPMDARLSVRVRPVDDSPAVGRGLETQFGATVELRPRVNPRGLVWRRFVASSHGYLQQSEYALTMALPPGLDPLAPARGVVFDLLVDFPGLPENGIVRIDRTVNAVLGDIKLAALTDREITVFRSGAVLIDGVVHSPKRLFSTRLSSTGSLALPDLSGMPAEPTAAPARPWFVGLEFDTHGARGPARVAEIVLDGQLEETVERCGSNVQLWNVTPGRPPFRVANEQRATSLRNDRSFLAVDWTLVPNQTYRVLCRVTELRASPRAPVPPGGALQVHGGLSLASPRPCVDPDLVVPPPDPSRVYLELRYRGSGTP